MKQPKSALPWNLGDSAKANTSADIECKGWVVVMGEDIMQQDAEYIVEACNNYPKAVELLKTLMGHIYTAEERKKTRQKIDSFLSEIWE